MNVTTTISSSDVGDNFTSPTTIATSVMGDNGHSVGAYSTVLAVTAHIVAMLFGGIKCLGVIVALLTKRNVNKYSYLPILTLLLACCCLNFVYSPSEISDLLTYHYHQRHPCPDFLEAKTSLYVFLLALIGMIIVLITLEALIRPGNCFGHVLRKIWPLTTCLFALVWSAILTAILISKLIESPPSSSSSSSSSSASLSSSMNSLTDSLNPPSSSTSYVIADDSSHVTFVTVTILITSLVFLVLLALSIRCFKSCVSWEGGYPHFRQKKTSVAMPEFLISQSHNDGDDDEEYIGGYDNVNEPSTSRSPSPSTPKLLMVSSPDSGSIKEGMPLPQTTPNKSSGNRLGINMAQVLGRRRHTICQISDTMPAPPDPVNKAKQYNYVRKFSVDISALQAQLQNPKIFKEAPFQSDMDLAKRAGGDGDKGNNKTPKPLQPLKPLNLKLDEKKTTTSTSSPTTEKDPNNTTEVTTEAKVETPQSATLSIPPPVIMVSNDDVIPEKDDNNSVHGNDDDEKENVQSSDSTNESDKKEDNNINPTPANNAREDNHKPNCNNDAFPANNVSTRPDKPTSLSLKGDNNFNNQIIKIDTNNSATTKNDVIVTSPIPSVVESSGCSPVVISCGSPQESNNNNSAGRPGGSNSGGDDDDDIGHKLTRLSCGLCATFVITMLPVAIVHALREQTSANAFVSLATCTLAISTALQTIVYPHLIACCDDVVRRAVRDMKKALKRLCLIHVCRRDDIIDDDDDEYDDYGSGPHRRHNVEDTSSTSHV